MGVRSIALAIALAAVAAGEARAAEDEQLSLKWSGRVFVRGEALSSSDYARDLSLPSARLRLDADYADVLEAQLEGDLAAPQPLMDAWLRVKGPFGLYARTGRFKPPFSARELTDRWSSPLVYRGLGNDTLHAQGFAGRRFGAEVGVKQRALAGMQLAVAALRGNIERDEDLAARLSFEPLHGLTLGANALAADRFRRGVAYGGDLGLPFAGAELSLEALALPLVEPTSDPAAPTYALGRAFTALASRRFTLTDGGFFLEPLVGGELLQSSLGGGRSTTLGLNTGKGDVVRLQVQFTRGALQFAGPVEDRVTAQLGAHF